MKNCAVILAAGDGKRMKSCKPKVLCEVLFKPMLDWVLEAVKECTSSVCVITGHQQDIIKKHLNGRASTAQQPERLGTGHAVMMAVPFILEENCDNVLVLCGDAPLLDEKTIRDALAFHAENQNDITVISAVIKDPTGYGRIVRDSDQRFIGIVEQKDATESVRSIQEVNSGAYWFKRENLLNTLPLLTNDNSQKEYYLTQTVEITARAGGRCAAFTADHPEVVLGANTRAQLLELNEQVRRKILYKHMENGVSIPCMDGVMIGPDASIMPDSVILPGTILRGRTVIGKNCSIGPGVITWDAVVGDGVNLHHIELDSATIPPGEHPAPYQRILSEKI